MAVVDQEFQRRSRTIAEDVQGARKRILLPLVTTERRERVDSFPKIDRLDRQQNAHLWQNRHHALLAEKRTQQVS